MSISRRKFIQVGAVGALVASIPIAGANLVFGQDLQTPGDRVIGPGDIPFASQKDPDFYFTKDTFTPYVNSTFRLRDANGRIGDFRLIAVEEMATKADADATAARTDSFSLFFTGGKRVWPGDSYVVSHDALGTFNLFVVPIVSRGEQIYQAVINHLVR